MKINNLQNYIVNKQSGQINTKNESQIISAPYSRDLMNMPTTAHITFGKTNKLHTKNEQEFIKLRDEFSEKLHKKTYAVALTSWNLFINSNEENEKLATKAEKEFNELYRDEKTLEKLEAMNKKGIQDKDLKRHIKKLLKDFRENITYKEDIDRLSETLNKADAKFNNHKFMIDGKETSKTEIGQKLKSEKNPEIRKELYFASMQAGNKTAEDIRNLVKERNEFAQKVGYDNYHDYVLDSEYNLKPEALNQLIDSLVEKIKPISEKMHQKRDAKIAKQFNINIDEIKPWHYGLQEDSGVEKKAEEFILTKEDNLKFSLAMYEGMGWDMEKANIQYDLYPKKGKSTHGFAFDVEVPKDTRILANLAEKDLHSLNTINHENGHCIYWKGVSEDLPYLDKKECTAMLTEAVAMLMGDLHIREPEAMIKELKMPADLATELNEKRKEDLVKFVEKTARIIKFENEMYKNPDQDLNELWYNLEKEILGKKSPENKPADWATVPHYRGFPAYYQNYLRAQIAAEQMHEAFSQKHGDMTYNAKTAEFFDKEMFALGASLTEDEMMIKITGKKLSPDAFINSLDK